jgi:peroxiredoxin Q/BCP
LGELDASVLGVSVDSADAHGRFARQHALPFPLLSDTGGQAAAAYGCLLRLGFMRVARRRTFVIAPDGRIAARFDRVDPTRHAGEVMEVLARLQRVAASPALVHDSV